MVRSYLHMAQQASKALSRDWGSPAVQALQAAVHCMQEARQPLPVARRDNVAQLLRMRKPPYMPMIPHTAYGS